MSAPRSRSSRPLLALVVACALLGACTGQRQVPDKYGDTTRTNFRKGCVASLSSDSGGDQAVSATEARRVCGCVYTRISGQGGIPFAEFKKINDDLEENPGPLPDSITSRIRDCQDPS